jgi:hypothetical protein
VIYTNDERIAECGTPEELIDQALRGEVAEYDAYLCGECYGYVVERDGEHLDSCWGFLGDDGFKHAKSEAESAAESEARAHDQLAAYEYAH